MLGELESAQAFGACARPSSQDLASVGHQLAKQEAVPGRVVLSSGCWAVYFSLLCYMSCIVTHTLWVGLMDAARLFPLPPPYSSPWWLLPR